MSQQPLDYATPRPKGPPPARRNPPLAKAGRMIAYAIVILAGAILCGLGSLQPGYPVSSAAVWGALIIVAGAIMLTVAMIR